MPPSEIKDIDLVEEEEENAELSFECVELEVFVGCYMNLKYMNLKKWAELLAYG